MIPNRYIGIGIKKSGRDLELRQQRAIAETRELLRDISVFISDSDFLFFRAFNSYSRKPRNDYRAEKQ